MKKFVLLLLAVFFVFSCKVGFNDAKNSLVANLRDEANADLDGQTDIGDIDPSEIDDDTLTEYAKKNRVLMFVADEEFALKIREGMYRYYSKNEGTFWFSHDMKEWENLYDFLGVSELDYYMLEWKDAQGNVIKDSDKDKRGKAIWSQEDKKIGKHVIYFKGVGNNRDFKLGFAYFDGNKKIGCYGSIIDLLASDTEDRETYQLAKNAFSFTFNKFKTLTHAPELSTKALSEYCYASMFRECKNLKEAPALPATVLATGCYDNMFSECTLLEKAPELPATDLSGADSCYYDMFHSCSGLKYAPALPATKLSDDCYAGMFRYCKSLEVAPELPAMDMEDACYWFMFADCDSLVSAPVLNSKNLAQTCYSHMFYRCKNLKNPPALPATVLATYCYERMFSGSSIESVPALPALTLAESCYASMFEDCHSIGEVDENLLKATVLPEYCYAGMFANSSIKTPLNIKVSSLSRDSMKLMFNGCKNLSYILFPIINGLNNTSASAMSAMFSGLVDFKSPRRDTDEFAQSKYKSYADYALNQTKIAKINGVPSYYFDALFGSGSAELEFYKKYNEFYTSLSSKDIKGYERVEMLIPSPFDTTTFTSKSPFTISSQNKKTWDGVIRYWNGINYVVWDGMSDIQAVKDCYTDDYVVYMNGSDNTVISNGNRWKITGSNVSLNLKLGALLECPINSDEDMEDTIYKFHHNSVIAENCFNSWFKDNTAIRSFTFSNPSTLNLIFSKKAFYSAFEKSLSLSHIDIEINQHYLYPGWADEDGDFDAELSFARMFANCPKLTNDKSVKIHLHNPVDSTYMDIFVIDEKLIEPEQSEESKQPAGDGSKQATGESSKQATGTTKTFSTDKAETIKNNAKSGAKKPIASQPSTGYITIKKPKTVTTSDGSEIGIRINKSK